MIEQAILCLAMNVYHEARGEPLEGQYAVALVTINRAKRNPNNICREVYKPKQFSWTIYKNHKITETKAWKHALQVAKKAFTLRDFTGGANHYHATYVSPRWSQELKYVGRWGNHFFYKEQ